MSVERHGYSLDGKYIVRLWDGSDRRWIDVSSDELSLQEAAKLWDEKTSGGKVNTAYEHFDYYEVFPAGTTMLFSSEIMDQPQSR